MPPAQPTSGFTSTEEKPLFVEEGSRFWPALVAGDGFKRLLFLAAHLAVAKRSRIFIVEEPDAFLHRKAIERLATLLFEATQRANSPQIFLTTHSIGLVRSLIGLNEGRPDTFAVFNTERVGEQINVRRYGPDDAEMNQPELERALG